MLGAAVALAGRFIKAAPYLLIAALLIWGGWQRHLADKWQDRAEQCQGASQAAAAQTKAMREAEAKAHQEKAREANARHAAALAGVHSDTSRFIAAHRVRPEGDRSAAEPQREADHAAKPQELPSAPVLVAEADVQRAAEWQAYGVACHDWALSISGDN